MVSNNITTKDILREYFENKIDYKYLNFLIDKATKYEDIGFYIRIFAIIADIKNTDDTYSYFPIIYDTEFTELLKYESSEIIRFNKLGKIFKNYATHGITYYTILYRSTPHIVYNKQTEVKNATNELYSDIKNKSTIMKKYVNSFITKPKNIK